MARSTSQAIEKLVAERKLTSEGMDPNSVAAIREQMERAQARRLQPHFIGAFFREAFTMLGGRISERETGRFEITRVPGILKERDRLIGRGDPVLDRYARVTFDKALINGQPQAELRRARPSAARCRRRCRARTLPAASRRKAACLWTRPTWGPTRAC